MPLVPRKLVVFGDSSTIAHGSAPSRAQRICQQNPTQFSGGWVTGANALAPDDSHCYGGQTLASTLKGQHTAERRDIFGGMDFDTYITTTCDADVCVINLGANDSMVGFDPVQQAPVVLGNGVRHAGLQGMGPGHAGGDCLQNAEDLLSAITSIHHAGKRAVVVGVPYFDMAALSAPGGLLAGFPELVQGFAARVLMIHSAFRIVCAMQGVPFIATHGNPIGAGQPAASPACTWDGLHPVDGYRNAVSDFVGTEVVRVLGL